jgi:starvation-inducible DNA-binding protein
MSDLVEQLSALQANVVAMYAQSHGYHWNVKGMLFKQIHAFLLEIYEDVFDSIDPISENIRKLGGDAPFGLSTWNDRATVDVNENPNLSAIDMLTELASVNSVIIAQLKNVFRSANDADEQGVANFIAERIDKHQFWNWQIKATLQSTLV